MTTNEHKELMVIYDILTSGRVEYARALLAQLLKIEEEYTGPEVA